MIHQKTPWAIVYLVLMLLPMLVGQWAAQAAGLESRPWLDEWASGLGMLGFALVLLSFVLLGRFKPLSGLLGSDVLMRTHQLFARTALLVLLLHPFFYTLWRAPPGPVDASTEQALRIGGGSWGLTTGLLALGCLLVLVASAVWRQRSDAPYERWRLMHSALALAVLGLGLHHTLVSGRYAQLTAVAAVWWGLAGLALLSWIWVYAVRPLWQGAHPYRIEKLQRCADRIWLLEIAPLGQGRARFRAGQLAWLKFGQRWPHRDNPFSISNAPDDPDRLQFLVKESGDMTRRLAEHAVGDTVFVDGPHGCFKIPAEAKAVVMHAGGIGVAPLVSLLAGAVAQQDQRPMRLIYADKHPNQMVDVLALSGAGALSHFAWLPMVEQPHTDWTGLVGRLDANGIAMALQHPAVAPLVDTAHHLICGPEPMMDAVETALMARSVPAERIVCEHFKYDFSGRSPLARRVRRAWWSLSAASLLGLALALAWR